MMNSIVGRGELKIAEAAGAFRFDFRGKTVLDIGSSTGGFTEYALRKGAKKVIAVEIGTRQMKAPLRFDPRVELHEKTDIFQFRTEEKIEVVLADVSFLSITKVLEYVKENLVSAVGVVVKAGDETKVGAKAETDFLIMVKPQFEARPEQLVRGVVKNEKMRREIFKKFETWLRKEGFLVLKKRDNETVGRSGNKERFYWLRLTRFH